MTATIFCDPCKGRFDGPSLNFALALFKQHSCTEKSTGVRFVGNSADLPDNSSFGELQAQNTRLKERLKKIAEFASKPL